MLLRESYFRLLFHLLYQAIMSYSEPLVEVANSKVELKQNVN